MVYMAKAVFVEGLKGGVGKTTVAVNMARKFSEHGKTALIDADIDSSNFRDVIPVEDGEQINIDIESGWKFEPYDWDGIEVFSMSLLTDMRKTVSMSGDRYSRIVNDVVTESKWGDIDFYVVDIPAGHGDIWRTLMEVFADYMTGSVVVMQPSAHTDAHRVLRMHEINEIPVVGVVENMAYFECPECESRSEVMGKPKIEEIADEYGVDALGQIPLSMDIRYGIEEGEPIFDDEFMKPVENAVDKVISMESDEVGILGKIRQKIVKMGRKKMAKVVGALINYSNKNIDISGFRNRYGFTGGKPINLIIVDEEGKELLGYQMILKGDTLKVIGNERKMMQPEVEIEMDFATLSRIIMGEKKLSSGKTMDYDVWDAYLQGDARVYGTGHTGWATELVKIMGSEEVTSPIRDKYSDVLEKMI